MSDHADQGSYVVALRAMFGLESGEYFRQNLANAFIVNWLWLPALLALDDAGAGLPAPITPARARAPVVLLVGTSR